MKLIPAKFHHLRFDRKFSVKELAKIAHVDSNTIYENLAQKKRCMQWDTLWRLCAALKCEPSEIASLDKNATATTEEEK